MLSHTRAGDFVNLFPGEALRVVLGVDADHTYSLSAVDIVRVGIATLTQNRTYTVDGVDADDGCTFTVSRTEDTGSHTLSIKDGPSSTVLVVLAAAGPTWATIIWHGANWHVFQQG